MKTKTNVASDLIGTKVIYSTDEFFAPAHRMLQTSDAVFIADKYDDNGKWMDGWETRRRRDGKHDYCLIKLGSKSIIHEFDIDTSHFTGNYAPGVAILGCCTHKTDDDIINNRDIDWFEVLGANDLAGDSHNVFPSQSQQEITHLRVDIFPDGGIARFRAFGQICFNDALFDEKNTNVIALKTGARAIYANNEHFGKLENILTEHKPLNMADGWETRRRREPGNDWGIIALAQPAKVNEIVVDTSFFKGNFPDRFSICATHSKSPSDNAVITQSMFWDELIGEQKLMANNIHTFNNLNDLGIITHIRLNIFPDGGIARLKLNGEFVR